MGRDDRQDTQAPAPPQSLANPSVSLIGEVDADRTQRLIEQLREAEKAEGDIVVEVTTLGGDAELARRVALEIGLTRERTGRRLLFHGKTAVYSAGTTIMSAFPRDDRYLTEDTMLLIHCRQLDKTVEISGPIRASLPQIKALSAEVENGVAIEERNFRRLIEGSDIELEELFEKALCNWYIDAPEALRLGLVAGLTGSNIP